MRRSRSTTVRTGPTPTGSSSSARVAESGNRFLRAGADVGITEIRLEQFRAQAEARGAGLAPFRHVARADAAHGIDPNYFWQHRQHPLEMTDAPTAIG